MSFCQFVTDWWWLLLVVTMVVVFLFCLLLGGDDDGVIVDDGSGFVLYLMGMFLIIECAVNVILILSYI